MVFTVKCTYFKHQNILMNPQNILMISYTYQAKFCRTTPELIKKKKMSLAVIILEGFFTSPKLVESPHQIVHKADALRLLLIHKFGGFYLDLDYVVLNDLSHYNNILVGNSKYSNNMNNSCFISINHLYLEQTQSQ